METFKTQLDKEVYEFIVNYIKTNGYAPTVREIADGVYSSVSIIHQKLQKLEYGYKLIQTKPRCPGAIRLVGYELVKQN